MKKLLKTLVVSLAMVLTMTASIFANPADDLKNQLLALGVPSSYVGSLVESIQKNNISKADLNKAKAYINQAKGIIGNTKDLTKLSQGEKNKLQGLASKAGNALGLKVNFAKNSKGKTTVVVTDSTGAAVVKMSTEDAIDSVTNFDVSAIVEVLDTVVDAVNDSNGGEFKHVGGKPTETATTYPAVMLLGALMVAGAGFIAVKGKKQLA